MTATTTLTTALALADRKAKTKRFTVPLTDLQAEFVTATAARLGWSKATLVREALFRYTAALESKSTRHSPAPPVSLPAADGRQPR